MAHSLASLRVRTLFRTRVRRPAKPRHLQLNELEPRQMPGNVFQGLFLGLASAGTLEPLMVMTELYGEDGLPQPPAPRPEPTLVTTATDVPPAAAAFEVTAADSSDETEEWQSITIIDADGPDLMSNRLSITSPDDLMDLSVDGLSVEDEDEAVRPGPLAEQSDSSGGSGADAAPPASALAGESIADGPAQFDGTANDDPAGQSIASDPASATAQRGQPSATPASKGGLVTTIRPVNTPAPAANPTPANSPVPSPPPATPAPDPDGDGVSDAVEGRAPNRGDANADGVADRLQPRVAALPAGTTGEFLAVESQGHDLRNVRALPAPARAFGESPLPWGLVGFEVHGVAPGGAAVVRMTLPSGARPTAYFKQDPGTGRMERFDFDGTTGAVLNGNVVTLHLVDGGRGDADGRADGVITDPGGGGPGGVIDVSTFGTAFGPNAWQQTQSGGTAGGKGSVAVEGGHLVLREGDSFVVTLERNVTIPAATGTLRFAYGGKFHTLDQAFINDAFEVALVDATGKTLVPTIRAGRDTYVNLSEELPIGKGAHTAHDGPAPQTTPDFIHVSGQVDLDVSRIPAGTTGRLIFRLVNDDSDTGTEFTILLRNNPVAVADTYSVNEDTQLIKPAAEGVLANDSDPNGDPLTAVPVSGPANGSVTLNTDGSFTYTPNANFNGTDTFTYKARDPGNNESDVATVTITVNPVNDPPVANPNNYSTNEDTQLTIGAPGVLGNDTDIDSTSLTAVAWTNPANGTLTTNLDGSFTYTPNPNFHGTDTFTYRASDGALQSAATSVTITVTPINDAPVANPNSYTTDEDVQLTIPAPGVLGNDTDVDGDNLTAVEWSNPTHGTLTPSSNGGFSYVPNPNFHGTDTFTYKASDGALQSTAVTVTITVTPVNDAPVANPDSYSVSEDTQLVVNAAQGVLSNDTDVDNNPLTAAVLQVPAHGSLSPNPNGSFTYTPNPDYNGPDSFTYKANDGTADSNVTTVSITVSPVNDPPAGVNDSYTVNEDTTLVRSAAQGVLANDTDPDNDPLTAALHREPAHGDVTLNLDGSFQYVPDPNFHGTDTFVYKAKDATLESLPVTVTITVTPVNDAPVANSDTYTINEDTQLTPAVPGVLGNDTDIDGDALTATLVTGPAHAASFTLNSNGSFTYVPAANYYGTDSFTYKANDGTALSATATVTITINPINDTPVVTVQPMGGPEGNSFSVSATFIDPDPTDTHEATIEWGDGTTSTGTLNQTADTVTGSHTYADNGSYNVVVRVKELIAGNPPPGVGSNTATVTNVAPTLDAGVSFTTSGTGTNEQLTALLAGRFTDPGFTPPVLPGETDPRSRETFTVIVNWGDSPTNEEFPPSSVTNGGDGTRTSGVFSRAHTYAQAGFYTITVTVKDDDNGAATRTFTAGILAMVVDEKPTINLKSNGRIPVHIEPGPNPGINLAHIDPATVRFGPAGARPVDWKIVGNGEVRTHFNTQETGIRPTDTVVYLTGKMTDGRVFVGLDRIKIAPGSGSGPGGVNPPPPSPAVSAKYFVADGGNEKIYRYTAAGAPIANGPIALDTAARGVRDLAIWDTSPEDLTDAYLWAIGGTQQVALQKTDGTTIGSWRAFDTDDPQGIASDGQDIWVVDKAAKKLLRYSGLARLTSFFGVGVPSQVTNLHADNLNPTGITTDGNYLWVVDNGASVDKVFVYTLAGGYEGSWGIDPANADPVGLTRSLTNSSHLWIVDKADLKVYRYTGAKSHRSGSHNANPNGGFNLLGPSGNNPNNSNPVGIADPFPGNYPPVAQPDTAYYVVPGTPRTISVLANDSDPEGGALTIVGVTTPAHGTATISGSAIVYTGQPGFSSDSFEYTIQDPAGATATATVTVYFQQNYPPVAQADTYYGLSLSNPTTLNVLANDHDPEGGALTITQATSPAGATVTIGSGGTNLILTPATGFAGGSFQYTVRDPADQTTTTTVTVYASPNQPPQVGNDTVYGAIGETPITIDVLANDYDSEGGALTVTAVTQPSAGTAAVGAGGANVVFTPAAENPSVSFQYTVQDQQGNSQTGTISVIDWSYSYTPADPSAYSWYSTYSQNPGVAVDGSALPVAQAMAADPALVTGANFVTRPAIQRSAAVGSGPLGVFGQGADARYAVLSTGEAGFVNDPGQQASFDLGGPAFRGNTDRDVTVLRVDVNVPAGANYLTFDFQFLSEEFPHFVGSYNDAFLVELDQTTWTTANGVITAPDNFARLPNGQPVSVQGAGLAGLSRKRAAGTAFDGGTTSATGDASGAGTGVFRSVTPITPGAHSLYFSIFDQGDALTDSSVLIRNLRAGTAAAAPAAGTSPVMLVDAWTVRNPFDAFTDVLISGTADTFTNLVGVTVNGTQVQSLDAAGNFFHAVTAMPGWNEFTIVATDAFDNTATDTVRFEAVVRDPNQIPFEILKDASASVVGKYGQTSFDERPDYLFADIAVHNKGTYLIDAPLLVGVINLSEPSVRVRDVDGFTPDGIPYFDISHLLDHGNPTDDRTLSPGETTERMTISFFNPERIPFTYDLVVLGRLNKPPRHITPPIVRAEVGKTYVYDDNAYDENGDPLTFKLVTGPFTSPDNMRIDAQTGVVTWTPGPSDLGNHLVRIEVSDGRGGTDLQEFVVTATAPVPNRPPAWKTQPNVAAFVNQLYVYPGKAVDPDGDAVTYSVLQGPTGLTIHATTGEVQWVPTWEQIGAPHTVRLKAADPAGLYDVQEYQLALFDEPGNSPPIIISEPSTYFEVAGTRRPAFGNVNPNLINLDLGNGQSQTVPVSITLPQYVDPEWPFADVVFVVDESGSMGDGDQEWIGPMSTLLNNALVAAGFGPNRYGLVGYGEPPHQPQELAHQHNVGPADADPMFGTAAELAQASTGLLNDGGFEDGYEAIRFALTYPFRPGAAKNIILVTDEDRDVHAPADLDRAKILKQILDANARLNVITDTIFNYPAPKTFRLLSATQSVSERSVLNVAIERTGPVDQAATVVLQTADGTALAGTDYTAVNQTVSFAANQRLATVSLTPINDSSAEPGETLTLTLSNPSTGTTIDPAAASATATIVDDDTTPGQVRITASPMATNEMGQGSSMFVVNVERTGNLMTMATVQVTASNGTALAGSDYNGSTFTANFMMGQPTAQAFMSLVGDTVGEPTEYFTLTLSNPTGGLTIDPALATSRVWIVDDDTSSALGIDWRGDAYLADGAGGYTTHPGGAALAGRHPDDPTVIPDYVELALLTNGGAWDIQKRRDGGNVEQSLVNALADLKFDEVVAEFDYDLFIRPSDATALFENLTGVVQDPPLGQPIPFNARFTGNGFKKAYNLEFVQQSTGKVLGSIPVNLDSDYVYDTDAIDPDDDPITYKLLAAPAGATINTTTGLINWIPLEAGKFNFSVQAADNRGGVDVQDFVVEVTMGAANARPQIVSTFGTQTAVGRTYVYQVRATDADQDRLTYSIRDVDPQNPLLNLSINPETGRVTFKPTQTQIGSRSFYVVASDGRGEESVPQLVTVNVLASLPNTNPDITSTGPTGAVAGLTYKYTPVVVDAEADELTFDLPVRAIGMTIDPGTGTLVWKPTDDQVGRTHSAVLRVRDPFGGIDMETIHIKVAEANRAPVFVSTNPPGPATLGVWYNYRAKAIDPNGDVVHYTLDPVSVSKGMTIDGLTGLFRWQPSMAPPNPQTGSHTITITADDLYPNGKKTQTFTLVVGGPGQNRPPAWDRDLRERVRSGRVYFATLEATDPDGDVVTFSLDSTFEGQSPPAGMSIVSTADGGYALKWDTQGFALATYPIRVKADDGRGQSSFKIARIKVVSGDDNLNPTITSRPPSLNATYNREYAYQLKAEDLDDDPVEWVLSDGPAGVFLDLKTGLLLWTPRDTQLGTHPFTIKAVDPFAGSDTQSFALTVRAANLPPYVTSTPESLAIIGQEYRYRVVAIDPEGGPLTFAVTGTTPGGATIPASQLWVDDQDVVHWKDFTVTGTYHLALTVTDDRGAKYQQIYDVVVVADSGSNTDRPPYFTDLPRPPVVADVSADNRWPVQATDPDGQIVNYALTEIPAYDPNTMPPTARMTFDANAQEIKWTPVAAHLTLNGGFHYFTIKATANGLSASARIQLQVRPANRPPEISSRSPARITAGLTYKYDVLATDLDNDPLAYALSGAPTGMTIDRYGRISWPTPPTLTQVTTYPFSITVADGRGREATEPVELEVRPDTTVPEIDIRVDPNPVNAGERARILVTVIDNVAVASVELRVNNQVVSLDERGVGYYTPASPGTYPIKVNAKDLAGNPNERTGSLLAISPDPAGPVISFNPSSPANGEEITAPKKVSINVSDPSQPSSDLKSYTLEVRKPDGTLVKTLVHVESQPPGGVILGVNGDVATFDPTTLPNGAYVLRLSATDLALHSRTIQRTVNVLGKLKLGNFTMSITDLTIPVSGVPITITRKYDTLHADEKGDFGYGWKMTYADSDVDTSLAPGGLGGFGGYPAFTEGTRVLLTDGEGRTEGYTFEPWEERRFFGSVWHPAFKADPGVKTVLTVKDAQLERLSTGEFISMAEGGIAYNPEDPTFGNAYTQHSRDGVARAIRADSGELQTITDKRDNKLTFADGAIESNRGRQIKIERDSEDRITKITDLRGNSVTYQYDFAGNLVAVTDRTGNTTADPTDRTARYTYSPNNPHYLEEAKDAFGRTEQKVHYDADGRADRFEDALGNVVHGTYNTSNVNNQGYLVNMFDQYEKMSKYRLDARGNMTEWEDEEEVTTLYTYDDNDYLTSETEVVGEIDGEGNTEDDDLKTSYDPNEFGLPESETTPDGVTTRRTFNENGQMTSETDSEGNGSNLYYYYSPPPRPGQVWKPAPLAAWSDPDKNAEGYRYTPQGDVTAIRSGAKFDGFFLMDLYSNGSYSQYYNPYGPPLWPTLIEHKKEYNSAGDLIKETNPAQVIIGTGRDPNGNDKGTSETTGTGGSAVTVAYPMTIDPEDRPAVMEATVTENGVTRTLWTTSEEFNDLGEVVVETDEFNNRTETTYDARGLEIESRTRVRDENNVFVWLTKRTVYDDAGRVTHVTDPFVPGSGRPTTGSRTEYDDAGKVRRVERRQGLTINIVGSGYDLRSEVGSPGTVVSAETTEYDPLSGRVIRAIDEYGRETQTRYDRFGRVSQTRTESATAAGATAWLITRTVYDAHGRPSVTTDPYVEGTTDTLYGTRTLYDQRGREAGIERLRGVVVALNSTTGNTTLTSAGTVISSTRTVYDDRGRIHLKISTTGEITRYEYDKYNRQVAEISHAVQEGSTWVSHVTERQYDTPNLKEIVRTYVRATWSANPNSVESTATYTLDRSQARDTTYFYDELERLRKTQFDDGSYTAVDYDDFERKTAEKDELGQVTRFEYDSLSRLTAVVQPAVTNPATGLSVNPRTEYRYDAYGNLVRVEDANDHVTAFGYDPFNRRASRTLPAVTGETTAAVETLTYNGYGDVDFALDFRGQKADYVYDYDLPTDTRLGLLRRVDFFPAGATSPTETVAYSYDPFGREDTVTETAGGSPRVTDTDYDGEGRVTRVLNADGEIRYGYNGLGQLTQMWTGSSTTLAGGNTGVEYEYDPFGRLAVVREVRRAGATLTAPVETRYRFNYAGDKAAETVTQGATGLRHTTYQYHTDRGWLMGVTNWAAEGGAVLSDFAYTRRADGRILTVSETVKQPSGSSVTASGTYTYDALNRLKTETVDTSAAGGDYATEYTLDLVGNRVKEVTTREGGAVQRIEATPDERDRLKEERVFNTAAGGTPVDTVTYQYDRNGSLEVRQTTSGSKLEQTWDLRNRLASATVSQWNGSNWDQQASSSYQYTADDIRSRVTENGQTTLYTIDEQSPSGYAQVVEERTPAGGTVASYVYGASLDPISVSRPGQGNGVFAADGHSGVRQVLAEAGGGTVLAAYRYDAFGDKEADAGAFEDPIGYRGERLDATTGQYNLRARTYDPKTGRFVAMDPRLAPVGDLTNLTRYGYAGQDPVNGQDPSGLLCLLDIIIAYYAGVEEAADRFLEGDGTDPVGDVIDGFIDGFVTSLIWSLLLGGACFEAGTPIQVPAGSKPIEELKGFEEHGDDCDYVLARNEFNPAGPVEARRVLRTIVVEAPVHNLHLGGRVIGTTADHPFYARGKGWVACHELAAGDEVLLQSGSWMRVDGVAPSGRTEQVYNLEVEADHTYFVGTTEWGFAVWAHNVKKCGPGVVKAWVTKGPLRRPGMGVRTVTDPKTGRTIKVWGQSSKGGSKTSGHGKAMQREVKKLAAKGTYAYATVQRSMRTATRKNSRRRLMPDVIGVRKDGKVVGIEVKSKTDKVADLRARLRKAYDSLPKDMRVPWKHWKVVKAAK